MFFSLNSVLNSFLKRCPALLFFVIMVLKKKKPLNVHDVKTKRLRSIVVKSPGFELLEFKSSSNTSCFNFGQVL